MMKIITQTPFYVWPLFAYLVFIGIKASKTNVVPFKVLFIMPVIFSIWSFYSILVRYAVNPFTLLLWAVSILLGVLIGSLVTRRLSMKFDKTNMRVEMPGSWTPLVLSMSIFSTRYFLGITDALHPELAKNWALLLPELIATMISGVFAGRVVACLQKYKTSPHVNLV